MAKKAPKSRAHVWPAWALALLPYLAVALFSLFFYTFVSDEYDYMNIATAFSRGEWTVVRDHFRALFAPYPFLLSLVYRVTGPSELAAKLMSLAFGVLAVYLLWLLARELLGEDKAHWSSLLFAASPLFAFLATRALTDSLFTALLVACVLALHRSLRDARWLVAFGLLAGLLAATRLFGLYALPLGLLFYALKKRWDLLLSKWLAGAALAFLAGFSPVLAVSQLFTGSPVQLILDFFKLAVRVQPGTTFVRLTDLIPTFHLFSPFPHYLFGSLFLLGALFPLSLAFWWYHRKRALDSRLLPFSLTLLVIALAMDLYSGFGLLNAPLFRYLAPATPFAAALAAVPALGYLKRFGWAKAALYALLALNVLASLGAVYYFGALDARSQDYRSAGLWAGENCHAIYSNIPFVMEHYRGQPEVPLERATCVALSSADGGAFDIPKGFSLAYTAGRVNIYRRA